jgi:hypothetical protein
MVLGNLVRLHWPSLVTLPSGESVLATTWEHYRYGVYRMFGNMWRNRPDYSSLSAESRLGGNNTLK